MPFLLRFIKPVLDVGVTLLLWVYYILGYLVFFSPLYAFAWLAAADRELAFQKLNHLFHRSFFGLLKAVTPGLSIRIDGRIRTINGSVVVSNHLSYLDPILFVSLFEKQKTIARSDLFGLPVFGWLLKTSGYIPSSSEGDFSALMIERIEGMAEYLASGGNLFIFPEGHRSRDGRLGPFNKGAFGIARRCRAPIAVLMIQNTHHLFVPGKFLFNTCVDNAIDVSLIGYIRPDYESETTTPAVLMQQVRNLIANGKHLT